MKWSETREGKELVWVVECEAFESERKVQQARIFREPNPDEINPKVEVNEAWQVRNQPVKLRPELMSMFSRAILFSVFRHWIVHWKLHKNISVYQAWAGVKCRSRLAAGQDWQGTKHYDSDVRVFGKKTPQELKGKRKDKLLLKE